MTKLPSIDYILKNYLAHRQCQMCKGIWFKFNHNDKIGVYRLAEIPPEKCVQCKPIDDKISNNSLFSVERWITGDELNENA
jgi:hypothetical protein